MHLFSRLKLRLALLGVLILMASMVAIAFSSSASFATTSTFTAGQSGSFVVPAGVTNIDAVLVGGNGGSFIVPGMLKAMVS